jgi:hypothetical protein
VFDGCAINNVMYLVSGCSSLETLVLPTISGVTKISWEGMVEQCQTLKVLDVTPLGNITVVSASKEGAMTDLRKCFALETILFPFTTAPTISDPTYVFGTSASNYPGRNNYDKGTNKLYVPTGATGYDSNYWASVLCNSSKCGFTLSATL